MSAEDERLVITKAAREARDAAWQRGYDLAAKLDKAGTFNAPNDWNPYLQHLYFVGICNYLSAKGRDIAGIDARVGASARTSLLGDD